MIVFLEKYASPAAAATAQVNLGAIIVQKRDQISLGMGGAAAGPMAKAPQVWLPDIVAEV